MLRILTQNKILSLCWIWPPELRVCSKPGSQRQVLPLSLYDIQNMHIICTCIYACNQLNTNLAHPCCFYHWKILCTCPTHAFVFHNIGNQNIGLVFTCSNNDVKIYANVAHLKGKNNWNAHGTVTPLSQLCKKYGEDYLVFLKKSLIL